MLSTFLDQYTGFSVSNTTHFVLDRNNKRSSLDGEQDIVGTRACEAEPQMWRTGLRYCLHLRVSSEDMLVEHTKVAVISCFRVQCGCFVEEVAAYVGDY